MQRAEDAPTQAATSSSGDVAMAGPLVLGGHVSPITLEEQQQIEVRDRKDRKAQHAAALAAATTQRPVAVQNVIKADTSDEGDDEAMPALEGDFDEQDQIVEEKRNCRLEAEKMLRSALTQHMKSVEDVGEAPKPTTIVARTRNDIPDHRCRSWLIRIKQLALRHLARRDPDWVQRVSDDAANSIDISSRA
jgi:hypothetical protein